jgi:hypothetical protein
MLELVRKDVATLTTLIDKSAIKCCHYEDTLYVINDKRLHVIADAVEDIEFESKLSSIGLFKDKLIVGDIDGYVYILNCRDVFGDCAFGPERLFQCAIKGVHENYITSVMGDVAFFEPDTFAFNACELKGVSDAVPMDRYSSWPLNMIDDGVDARGSFILGVGSNPSLSISRVEAGPSLAKLASDVFSILTGNNLSTDLMELKSRAMTLMERLDDPGRQLHRVEKLSPRYCAAYDDKRGQIIILDVERFLIVCFFKGYRDSTCLLVDSHLFILSRKRNLVHVVNFVERSVVEEHAFEDEEHVIDILKCNSDVTLVTLNASALSLYRLKMS